MNEPIMKQKEPYANEKDLSPFLACVDYTVSRETFTLLLDAKTDLLITSPRPSLDRLSAYYESEDYISHTDSKRSIMDKAYQVIKNYSVKKKVKMINDLSIRKGRVLDIGCGTGVLAILTEMKGAKTIDAIDIDNWCYLNSIENVERNKCKEISVLEGDANLIIGKHYDVIIANINRNILLYDIAKYAECLNENGILFLSGFYKTDIPIIESECKKYMLKLIEKIENNNSAP